MDFYTYFDGCLHRLDLDVTRKLDEFLKKYSANIQWVRKIIFADEDNYGSALDYVKQGETYTNEKYVKGYGKCISINIYQSDVILRIEIINFFLKQTNEYEDLDAESQYYLHLIFHEIGHAEDNVNRALFKPDTIHELRYKVDDFSALNIRSKIQDELAACYLSRGLVNKSLFEYMARNFLETEQDLLSQVIEKLNPNDIAETFLETTNLFWRIISEYAKLVGYSYKHDFSVSKYVDDAILLKTEEVLNQNLCLYPNWNVENFKDMKVVFLQYSLKNGVKFVEHEDKQMDAIFWNT